MVVGTATEKEQGSSVNLSESLREARISRLIKKADVFLELSDRFEDLSRRLVAELSGIGDRPK